MSKKRIILILTALVLCAALAVVYFVISKEEGEVQPEPYDLLPGEVMENGELLMFEHLDRTGIQELRVTNTHGSYALVYNQASGDFTVENNATLPLDPISLSSVIVDAGYALTSRRLTENCEDLSQYGLDSGSVQATYTIVTRAGQTHTVRIGNSSPDGKGNYCQYEGRDAVYVSNSNYSNTLLCPLPDLVTPIVAYPLSTADYYCADNFVLIRDGEVVVQVDYLTETERDSSNYIYRMLSPAQYVVSDVNFSSILQGLTSPYGVRTVAVAPDSAAMTQEMLAVYGLDEEHYKYQVLYTYHDLPNLLLFSEKNEDGLYYCYSTLFNLVAECDSSVFGFIDWKLIDFTSNVTLSLNINDVETLTLEGLGVNETFRLTGTGDKLAVRAENSRVTFDADGILNFRQLYKTILVVYMQDYAEKKSTDDLIFTVSIHKRNGEDLVYRYYGISTRRCYYTVNGEGEFYVLRDSVEKIASDYGKLMSGEPIDSWSKG